jgi:general secretion pathway protein I
MNRQQLGFTLFEVLVALVIVSLGMMAVKTQLDRYVLTAIFMENKTLASWIGSNRITEFSVANVWPEPGTSSEEVEFAGRRWLLDITISESGVENLRRIDVDVADANAPETLIQRMTGLVEPPPPRGFAPVNWVALGTGE